MNLFIYIAIGVVAVAVLLIGRAIQQSRRFKKTGSEIIRAYKARVDDWMKNVRQADTDDDLIRLGHQEPEVEINGWGLKYRFHSQMRELVAPHEKKIKAQPCYLDMKRKIEGAKNRYKRQRGLRLYQASQAKQDVVDKLLALFEVLALPAPELAEAGLTKAQVRFQIMQTYAPLLRQARQGDRGAFLKLREFFGANKDYYKCKPIGGRPEDWAELVVRYLENPDLSDFTQARYNHEMPQPGKLRLMAAEAIRTESLLQSQEVLAYCNHSGKYHNEVGDRLLAELAKLVDRLQVEALEKKEVLYR